MVNSILILPVSSDLATLHAELSNIILNTSNIQVDDILCLNPTSTKYPIFLIITILLTEIIQLLNNRILFFNKVCQCKAV
jgi:hypothetical protein